MGISQPGTGIGLQQGALVGELDGRGPSQLCRPSQFFQVPYTALTMLLTPSPRERDSATAYREHRHRVRVGDGAVLGPASSVTLSPRSVPGMTMEMAGTLMGAAVHGLIVSGAHARNMCEDATLPGPVAISPDSVSTHTAGPRPSHPGPLYGVASFLLSRFFPRTFGSSLGLSSAHRASFLPFSCS